MLHDGCLSYLQLRHYFIMLSFLFTQFLDFFTGFLKRFNHLLVSFFLIHLLLLLASIFFLCICQLIFELFDNIQICICNLLIVVLNIVIFLGMLLGKFLNSLILFVFDLLDHSFPLSLHFLSQQKHFMLVLQLNFIGYSLEFSSYLGCLLVLILSQSIKIFLMPDFLLFLLDFKSSKILFKLTLIYSMLVLYVFKRYLSFFL